MSKVKGRKRLFASRAWMKMPNSQPMALNGLRSKRQGTLGRRRIASSRLANAAVSRPENFVTRAKWPETGQSRIQ